MARRATISQTNAGTTAWVAVDSYSSNISLAAVIASGTPTYTIQHTLDDVLGGATATAFDHDTLALQTTSQDGNYAFPIAAIRMVVTGTGVVNLTILQSGGAIV